MARTQVPVTVLTANTVVADVAGTALDPTNGHYIDVSAYGSEELILRITNTFDGAKTVTIVAGDNPPADASASLAVACGDGDPTPSTKFVGPLSSARFIKAGSQVHLDVAASMTGTVAAFIVPRTA